MGPYSEMVCTGYVVVPDSAPILKAHGFDLGVEGLRLWRFAAYAPGRGLVTGTCSRGRER